MAAACPTFTVHDAGSLVGVSEVSGIVASRTHTDVLWVHEDSGRPAALHAITPDGHDLGTYAVDGATNRDWEDIAATPGALYVGDIGDNRAARSTVTVLRVEEPVPDGRGRSISVTATYTLRYPSGPADAEALLVDPRQGDLYVLTKNWDGEGSRILRAPASALAAGGTTTMQDEGEVRLDAGVIALPGDRLVTAADISPDGDEILVRTYGHVLLFRRGPGETVAEALRRPPCRARTAPEDQGEAIAFTDAGYITVGEGEQPVLHAFGRNTAPLTTPAAAPASRSPRSRLPLVVGATVALVVGLALWWRRRMGDSARARDRQG